MNQSRRQWKGSGNRIGGNACKQQNGQTNSGYDSLSRQKWAPITASTQVFTSIIVHALICSRIAGNNSLLVGLPKVRLSPLQSVLNAAARLVARPPRTSHISAFMFNHLHRLMLIVRIQLKVVTLIYCSHIGHAHRYKYLRYLISASLSLPSLFVRYVHLTGMISVFRDRGLLWQQFDFCLSGS